MRETEESSYNENRNLSACETLIMKTIWDAGEDISVPDLIAALKAKYSKDYARTTMATFLLKLSEKGFARVYRKGKLSYVYAIKSQEEYKRRLLQEETDFWYHGNAADMVSALCSTGKLTRQDADRIRRMLDEQMDDT
ncbi:MAG: BlaI/MecI/CopY family transcriptional regulator [Acetatifactor sp.]|nr:BlaI/MecI/CopY family transcriptional regulator [Acetatifactor sp.]